MDHDLRQSAVLYTLKPAQLNPAALREKCLPWLNELERQRYQDFLEDYLAHDYLAAHSLTRAVLGRSLTIEPAHLQFQFLRYGKPVIAGPPAALHFNTSRTTGVVATLISEVGPVGVDVESAERIVDWHRWKSAWLDPSSQPTLPQWVMREALVKASGQGVGMFDRKLFRRLQLKDDHFVGSYHLRQARLKQLVYVGTAVRSRGVAVPIHHVDGLSLFEAGITVID